MTLILACPKQLDCSTAVEILGDSRLDSHNQGDAGLSQHYRAPLPAKTDLLCLRTEASFAGYAAASLRPSDDSDKAEVR